MTGLIPGAAPVASDVSALGQLLTLLADPKASQARLDALKQAAEAAQAVVDQAASKSSDIDAAQKVLDVREANLNTREQGIKTAEDNAAKKFADLSALEDTLHSKEDDLTARTARFESRQTQAAADLDTRGQALSEMVSQHEAAMSLREQTVTEREAGAKAMAAEAQAMKDDYTARIAKLNAAIAPSA